MKELSGEKVLKKTLKNTKKLKVNEVVQYAITTIREINKYKKDLISEEISNTFITYFALTLLARTNNAKDYKKIFDECGVGEIEESEA